MRIFSIALFTLLACNSNAGEYNAATGGEINPRAVPIHNYQETLQLFSELGYTQEQWQAGIREIPRIYLSDIPARWSEHTSHEITVQLKKALFFRALAPLALRNNELILQQRSQLQSLQKKTGALDATEQAWLHQLATEYRVDSTGYADHQELAATLLPRVDIVPVSQVLAQAAEESGWGTSRFAFTGNALFGQWTWGDEGIAPEQQRAGMGDYKIAAFDAPLQSVQAHARNLNTHHAYLQYRIERAQLRANGKIISGYHLAGTLSSYSERGTEYVKSLRSIINYNKLQPADDALFAAVQAIVLVPTE